MKAWASCACSGVAFAAGADGPDRFVSDHRFLQLLCVQDRRDCRAIGSTIFFPRCPFPLVQRFADANNRPQRSFMRGVHFAVHDFVRFAEQGSAVRYDRARRNAQTNRATSPR